MPVLPELEQEPPRFLKRYRYFIAYDYTYTEHPNGGDTALSMGHTVREYPAVIDSHERVSAMATDIALDLQSGAFRYNPVVRLVNFFLLKEVVIDNPAIIKNATAASST